MHNLNTMRWVVYRFFSLKQRCEGFTCLFTRNDLVEMGCLLALLLRQRCGSFTCLFVKHDLGARCLAFGARVLH